MTLLPHALPLPFFSRVIYWARQLHSYGGGTALGFAGRFNALCQLPLPLTFGAIPGSDSKAEEALLLCSCHWEWL